MKFDLSTRRERARKSRRGLTLIELIVVLIILVGLGGLLVPVISNALTRTHVATCSANFPEITNALVRMETFRGEFGTGWDSGMDGTASVNGATVDTLAAGEGTALLEAGITQIFDHTAAPSADYNITFNPEYQAARVIADGESVVTLDATQELQLSLDPAGKYVWFGIGPNWTGLRDVAFETPVHFGDTPGFLPHEVYSRYGAVFQVADAAGPLEVAGFKGVSYSLDGTNFETADNHAAVYWTEVNDQ